MLHEACRQRTDNSCGTFNNPHWFSYLYDAGVPAEGLPSAAKSDVVWRDSAAAVTLTSRSSCASSWTALGRAAALRARHASITGRIRYRLNRTSLVHFPWVRRAATSCRVHVDRSFAKRREYESFCERLVHHDAQCPDVDGRVCHDAHASCIALQDFRRSIR